MTEHERTVAAIESSRVFSMLDRVVIWASRVVGESRAASVLAEGVEWTSAIPSHLIRFGLGVVFVVGALTHILLMVLLGPRESWLWPLLPSAGLVIGAVLLVFGTARTGSRAE